MTVHRVVDNEEDSHPHNSLKVTEEIERSETVNNGRYDETTVSIHEIKNSFETNIRPEGFLDISENEVASVSAEISNDTNEKMVDESNDLSSVANPHTTQGNDVDDTCNHRYSLLIKNQHTNESDDQQTSKNVKLESETSMLIDDSPCIHSGDEIKSADSKDNNIESNTTPIDSSPTISSDDVNNTFNISHETIPSEVLDAIRGSLANRRARLVYMTPEEVLGLRHRIVPVQTSRGPLLFLPLTRQSPYTPQSNSSLEHLIREHHQPSQEDLNVQHIMSLFRRSPGMRMCRLKDRT